MKFTKNYIAESDLLTFINQQYAIKGGKIRLYRGRIFYIQSPIGRKVFKLYPPTCTDSAVQTTHIIPYLDDCGYPVVQIIPTVSGELYVTVNMPEGNCVGVLFEYANGIDIGSLHRWRNNKQPLINPLTKQFSRQVGLMHRLMEHYEKPLINRGREHFVDKLVWLMSRDNYDCAAVVYCGCIISELTMGMVDEKINPQRLDMQHEWLMRWREYCGKLK